MDTARIRVSIRGRVEAIVGPPGGPGTVACVPSSSAGLHRLQATPFQARTMMR